MTYPYSGKKDRRLRQETHSVLRLRWVLLAVCLLAIGGVVWKYRTVVVNYYSELLTWAVKQRKHLASEVKLAEHPAAQEAVEQQIHFEFYTALPNMQVQVSQHEQEPSLSSVPPAKQQGIQIANAEDLERELSEAVNNKAKKEE